MSIVNQRLAERQRTIEFLRSNGLPVLPQAPQQRTGSCNGKRPAYLNTQGKVAILSQWRNYIAGEVPTEDTLKTWFQNDETGVGTLGGINGVYWIDIDRKTFESQFECDTVVTSFIENNGLGQTRIEQTGGGGYHIAVKLRNAPNFKNFAFFEGGKHCGEIIGKGSYIVLAGSTHASGNIYRVISNAVLVPTFNGIEDLGLFPAKAQTAQKPSEARKEQKQRKAQSVEIAFSKDRRDLRNYINLLDGVTLNPTSSWVNALCPCHADSKPSFGINMDTGAVHCQKGCTGSDLREAILSKARATGHNVPTNRKGEAEYRISTGLSVIEPNISLSGRYLPSDLHDQLPIEGLLLIKANKGCGKSTMIGKFLDRARAAKKRVVVFSPRINLGRALAADWGVNYIDTVKTGLGVDKDRGYVNEVDDIALCLDSAEKLEDRDFSNTVIVLDEAELALSHLLKSDTCKSKRVNLIRVFEGFLKEALEHGGCVLASDADLSNPTVEYLMAASNLVDPFLVVNDHLSFTYPVEALVGRKMKGAFHDRLALSLGNGERVFLTMDSQTDAEALDLKLSSEGYKVLRVDSTTSGEDWAQQFMRHPDKFLSEEKPNIVIATPSISVGVSIDNPIAGELDQQSIKYFQAVYGYFVGVLTPQQASQGLSRVRTKAPRTVWISGDIWVDGMFTTQEVRSAHKRNKDEICEAFGFAQMTASQVLGVDVDEVKADQTYEMMARFSRDELTNPAHELFCILTAQENFGRQWLNVELLDLLRAEGHAVATVANENSISGIEDEIAEKKDEVKRLRAKQIAEAPDINEETANRLKGADKKTREEQLILTKYYLKRELKDMELTPDFVYHTVTNDSRNTLNAYILAAMVQDATLAYKATSGDVQRQAWRGDYFIPDIDDTWTKCNLLNELGLYELIDPSDIETQYSQEHKSIKTLQKKALKHRQRIKEVFGITVTENTRGISIASALLKTVGLGLSKKEKNKGRAYTLDAGKAQNPHRQAVISALLDAEYLEEYNLENDEF